jgi:D-amino peptidase
MRIYISFDLEGIPAIFDVSQTDPRGRLHEEARQLATSIVKKITEILFKEGAEEIYIADSHWYMGNLKYEEFTGNVYLIRGRFRPLSMMHGIERGFDAVMLIGYHSGAGTEKSVLEHTYSSRTYHELFINGIRTSEFYLNALVAGHYDTPVILVAGDDKLKKDVIDKAPWIEYVVLKESVSRYSAITPSLEIIYNRLNEGIARAISKLRDGDVKPLKIEGEVVGEFVLKNSAYADYGELIPGMERLDAYTLRYRAKDITELYNIIMVISGLSMVFER